MNIFTAVSSNSFLLMSLFLPFDISEGIDKNYLSCHGIKYWLHISIVKILYKNQIRLKNSFLFSGNVLGNNTGKGVDYVRKEMKKVLWNAIFTTNTSTAAMAAYDGPAGEQICP